MNVSVAVIIPNYNDAKYISRSVRSVMMQSLAPDEVIVVDDCSTDNSIEAIRELQLEFPSLKLIKHALNLGVYGALATGRAATTSEYVMFVAANDFLLQGLIAQAKHCLEKHPGVGLWSAMGWRVDEEDKLLGPVWLAVPHMKSKYFSADQCRSMASRFGSWFAGPSVIYNRAIMEGVGAFNPDYFGLADLICALMVASKAGAVFSPEPFVVIRMHADSYRLSTYSQATALVKIFERLSSHAPIVCPELFDSSFISRTVRRYVFAAVNASSGQVLLGFETVLPRVTSYALLWIQKFIPSKLKFARIALAFVVLRYFDFVVSLWNRVLLCRLISNRHKGKYTTRRNIIYK